MKSLRVSRVAGAAVLVGALGATVLAFAADFDAIAARRALMKQDGANAKLLFDMSQGTIPLDAGKAVEAANLVSGLGHTFAGDFDKYFPDTSKTGDTHAKPELWDNKDDVKARFASLEADGKAVAAAVPQGADAFKAAMGKLGGACGGCHEKYKSR